jgi:RNA polymerase sigma-70 factor (ECF subfamily)
MNRDEADRFMNHLRPLQRRLEAYAGRILWDRQAVADVLQSAVAAAFRDFDLYAEGTNFPAWIFAYLHRESQNANRKYRRDVHEDLPEALPANIASVDPAEELPIQHGLLADPDVVIDQCDAVLAEGLRMLRPVERSVLLLHAIGEFKYREIAEILKVPIGTVMSALARSRNRLRTNLAKFGDQKGLLGNRTG